MSVQENDLTVKIAFVTALHELTGAHVCGLIKNSSKDKDTPKYTVKHAYGKLGDNHPYRDWETDRKSTRLNSSHSAKSRMPSSA